MNYTIHTFNTKRLYTQHGQRIAYAVLSTGNVAMVDIDRNIDYILTCAATNSAVLAAYDDPREFPRPKFNADELKEFHALESLLIAAAKGSMPT